MSSDQQMQQSERVYISMEQEHEVHYWARELGITDEQFRHAVNAAGDCLEDIRRYLRK